MTRSLTTGSGFLVTSNVVDVDALQRSVREFLQRSVDVWRETPTLPIGANLRVNFDELDKQLHITHEPADRPFDHADVVILNASIGVLADDAAALRFLEELKKCTRAEIVNVAMSDVPERVLADIISTAAALATVKAIVVDDEHVYRHNKCVPATGKFWDLCTLCF
jgi:hypothetical protein